MCTRGYYASKVYDLLPNQSRLQNLHGRRIGAYAKAKGIREESIPLPVPVLPGLAFDLAHSVTGEPVRGAYPLDALEGEKKTGGR